MAHRRRRYLSKALIDADPLGLGFSHRTYALGSVRARHKWNREESAYCVANECICAELGRFIGLPIPPYAVTEVAEGELAGKHLFSSLDFNWDDRDLSPVMPENCLASLSKLCAGVLMFDIFITNADRHDKNLAVDRMDNPKDLRVFDHDVALFGTVPGKAIERMNKLQKSLGITGKPPTGGNEHVFLRTITSNEHFKEWINRIHAIPASFIERICHETKKYGVKTTEAERAAKFLKDRTWELAGVINRWNCEFSSIDKWTTV